MSTIGNAESYIELKGDISMADIIHGKSAYEVALMNGFKGTEAEWVEWLRNGVDGKDGNPGVYVGTGEMPEGYSVQIDPSGYAGIFGGDDVSVSAKTIEGTEAYVTETVKDGVTHIEFGIPKGEDGYTPQKGVDYWTEADISAIASTITTLIGFEFKKRARIGYVTVLADSWVGENSPYAQVVTVTGLNVGDKVTENSQVDLTPSVEQLAIFHNKDLAFVTENEDGIVTVYAIGQKPENDYTIQVTITEVGT